MQHSHPRGKSGSGRRSVYLSGLNRDCRTSFEAACTLGQSPGKQTERHMRPIRVFGMCETNLIIGGIGDANSKPCDVMRFVFFQRETQGLGIDNDKTVATIGRVDLQTADAFYL